MGRVRISGNVPSDHPVLWFLRMPDGAVRSCGVGN